MVKIFYCLFVLCLSATFPLFSQVDTAWTRIYNGIGSGSDVPSAIAVDESENVYVTGSSGGDYITVKYNSAGAQQWIARYNGPGNSTDIANAIAVDHAGNIYVTGESRGLTTYDDYATVKYSSSGDTLWVRRYNHSGSNGDQSKALAVDGLGNVYVTGSSLGPSTSYDYATIKYTASGDTAWIRRFNNNPVNSYDEATAIVVDDSGNVYVTGGSYDTSTDRDYLTIKYNSSGDTLWIARYNGTGTSYDIAKDIAVDDSGYVYVTGYCGADPNYDYVTIKYNAFGDTVWTRRYCGPANRTDEPDAVAVDSLGNVYVTGESRCATAPYFYFDFATIKYNSSGDTLWVRRYNGPGNVDDYAQAMAIDRSGNVYVTGSSEGIGTFNDYATLKYSSAGVEEWVQRYNGSGNSGDGSYAIAVGKSGSVYITGMSYNPVTSSDYLTIKYISTGVGVEIFSQDIPESFQLLQNYPNPFNPTTTIKYTVPTVGTRHAVSLRIYDVLGRKVATLVNEIKSPGSYQIPWNASGMANGVYFYRLECGNNVDVKKLMLLK